MMSSKEIKENEKKILSSIGEKVKYKYPFGEGGVRNS